MKILRKRINDRKFLGLIARFLNVDILNQEGLTKATEVGTPQGSVMSPILSNIFLHYALDTWFVENYASQQAVIVKIYRWCILVCLAKSNKQKIFFAAYLDSLSEYNLSVNEEKTAIINFAKGKETIFSFLGFTFFWNKRKGWNKINLVIKTQHDKLAKKIQEFANWFDKSSTDLGHQEKNSGRSWQRNFAATRSYWDTIVTVESCNSSIAEWSEPCLSG